MYFEFSISTCCRRTEHSGIKDREREGMNETAKDSQRERDSAIVHAAGNGL